MASKEFAKLCEIELIKISDFIENKDLDCEFDVEYMDGILNISTSFGTYVVNMHQASQKIWFSSPISGADYFSYNNLEQKWLNDHGQELNIKIKQELKLN